MKHIEQLRHLLIDFGQEFDEFDRSASPKSVSAEIPSGTTVISMDVGHSYAVEFEFDADGNYLGCDLGV